MKNLKNSLLATVSFLALMVAAPAIATPIVGEAVTGMPGGTTIDTGSDGWIDFYIPLSGSEVFDGNQTSDTCNTGVTACAGSLEMYLHFDADWAGGSMVTIDFDDLDVGGTAGFGDNDYFFEVLGLTVYGSDGTTKLLELTADEVAAMLTGNSNDQQLVLNFSGDGDFYIHFDFGVYFGDNARDGRWRNTLESLRAEAVSVPEPGTLALLGFGLLLIAFLRRPSAQRRRPRV